MGISEVVDTSHEMESQALINTPEDETFMEYLVDYDSPNNLAKGDGASYFTVSNTVFDVLRHRDLINKSLSRLQGTESHVDALKRQRSLTYTLDELNEKFESLFGLVISVI